MEPAAASSPMDLLSLLHSSEELAPLYSNYSRQLFKTACTNALPSHPQFVLDIVQARFSAHSMTLSPVEKGNELDAWVVTTAENDIWSPQYSGSRLQALHYLVWNINQIDAGAEQWIEYFGRETNPCREVVEELQCGEARARVKEEVVQMFWLQESMRLRTYHRAATNVAEMMPEICSLDDEAGRTKLKQAIVERQKLSQLYYRYLARVDEKYEKLREMGRSMQKYFLEIVQQEVEEWQWRLQGLIMRWEWRPTFRLGWADKTETDWDMVEQMPEVAMADLEFEDFQKDMGWDRETDLPREACGVWSRVDGRNVWEVEGFPTEVVDEMRILDVEMA